MVALEGQLSMKIMNHNNLVSPLKINKNGRCVRTMNLASRSVAKHSTLSRYIIPWWNLIVKVSGVVRRTWVGSDCCFENLLAKVILCITGLWRVTVTQVVEISVTTKDSPSHDPTYFHCGVSLLGSNLFHFKIHCLDFKFQSCITNSSHVEISIMCGTLFYFHITRVKVTSADVMEEKKI